VTSWEATGVAALERSSGPMERHRDHARTRLALRFLDKAVASLTRLNMQPGSRIGTTGVLSVKGV
jgi:hypothetical protein